MPAVRSLSVKREAVGWYLGLKSTRWGYLFIFKTVIVLIKTIIFRMSVDILQYSRCKIISDIYCR